MSTYVETIVGPGESVTHFGHVSLLAILPSLLGGAVLVVIGLGLVAASGAPAGSTSPLTIIGGAAALLGVIVVLVAMVRRNSTELAVTNRRVIAKFGVIGRRTIEMNLAKIESVRVEQSMMGRLFGFGSLVVVGTGSTLDPIPYIADPIAFRQAIQAATDALPKG